MVFDFSEGFFSWFGMKISIFTKQQQVPGPLHRRKKPEKKLLRLSYECFCLVMLDDPECCFLALMH